MSAVKTKQQAGTTTRSRKKKPPEDKGRQTVRRKIADLTLDPDNARRHGETDISSTGRSLSKFGQQSPVVVTADGLIVKGNGTVMAAMQLGWTEIDCWETSLTGKELRAYSVADNQTALLSDWDHERLKEQLQDLEDRLDLRDALGFDDQAIKEALSWGEFDVNEVDPPDLPSGDREPFQQMTFTLHDSQVELVKDAIARAKLVGGPGVVNENSNGNALARIAEAYCGPG